MTCRYNVNHLTNSVIFLIAEFQLDTNMAKSEQTPFYEEKVKYIKAVCYFLRLKKLLYVR